MIIIVDYGMGNLGSVHNMFKKIGVKSKITSDINQIAQAEKLVLPGVGSFDAAMKQIRINNFFNILNELVLIKRKPIMGICLGMQMLFEKSEEGELAGFNWIKGEVKSFNGLITKELKIPHMGWNDVALKNENQLVNGFKNEIRFYFVHSYFVKALNPEDQLMTCEYGITFDAAVHHNNIYGVQFHPEKSHRFGMQLLKNFSEL